MQKKDLISKTFFFYYFRMKFVNVWMKLKSPSTLVCLVWAFNLQITTMYRRSRQKCPNHHSNKKQTGTLLLQLLQLMSWKYVYHNLLYHINFLLLYHSPYNFQDPLFFKSLKQDLKSCAFDNFWSHQKYDREETNQHLYQQTSFMYSNVSHTFYSIHTDFKIHAFVK